ncbi:LacI family DNA-binding transcriptional regulator [Streptomyces sp. NPDC053431]|uniref:LacI family DNA-binding transcriptional regulator n=1 Tax=Streptomyces sp. NPDC053431 TaxID=3365703 RepID=UPI0037D63BE8
MAHREIPATGRELKFRALVAQLRQGMLDGTWPPGSKLPTERALAAETGVSVTTVRRAYEDLVALGLVERRQGAGTFAAHRPEERRADRRVVGVLVPDTAFYYPRVLHGIEQELAAAGARLVLACSHYDPDEEDAAVERLLSAGVHGLLLVPTLHTATDPGRRAEELLALSVPAVLVERRLAAYGPGDPTEHVCTDHEGGAYDAVRHLRGLGHRRLGLVVRSDAPTTAPIGSGFARAIADLGLPTPCHQSDAMAEWNPERADRAVAALRAAGATAALCFGDREAALVLAAARRAGLRVPDDLALISYDNEFADVAETPLTAVSPPKFQVGRLAAQILLRRLTEGGASPLHQVQLRPRLVVRASCGAAPGDGARRDAHKSPSPAH